MQAQQENHTTLKNTASYVLSFSLLSLAVAIIYFTWQISMISQKIPDILTSVEQASIKIEPIVKQVNDIKVLVPSVVTEVSEIRQQIPLILDEVKLVREQVPQILTEVEAVRSHIPEIINTSNMATNAVVLAVDEVKAVRPLVPEILNEVKATREAIPPMLDRTDKIVSNLKKAGKDASKGAVTGVLTGIITAPFEIVGSLGKKMFAFTEQEIKHLKDKDLEIIKQVIHEVLSSDEINYTRNWKSSESNVAGKVTLLEIKEVDGKTCKVIQSVGNKSETIIFDKKLTACLDEEGSWERTD